jgi:hypothetical protein
MIPQQELSKCHKFKVSGEKLEFKPFVHFRPVVVTVESVYENSPP